MMSDVELFGVYLNAELITSLLALSSPVPAPPARLAGLPSPYLAPRLFETALFFIAWGAVLAVIKHSSP